MNPLGLVQICDTRKLGARPELLGGVFFESVMCEKHQHRVEDKECSLIRKWTTMIQALLA